MLITLPHTFTTKDGRSMLVREATWQDAEKVIQYVKVVGDESENLTFTSNDFNKTISEEVQIIMDHQKKENHVFIIAEMDDQIVGQLNVMASHKPRLFHVGEFGISVRKSHWGLGVGSALMQAMVDWAKQSGVIRKLNLMVRADNEKAQGLYKKFGFEYEGTNRRDMIINGQMHDAHYMGLLID
jgi:RimJ/RimL family protein N-acetyltransferase